MSKYLTLLIACGNLVLFGCIPHPLTYKVRARLDAPDLEQRVLSVQMVTPSAAGSERVICHGVFTAALLEGSQDTVDDFLAGYAMPDELRDGELKLILQEAGASRVFLLPGRFSTTSQTIYIRIRAPPDLDGAEVKWIDG